MLTYSEFSKATMKGIQAANNLHVRWTDGWTVQDRGAEHLISTEIARSLFNSQNKKDGKGFVHLEASPLEILDFAPKKRGRYEQALRSNGRVDVVLCDKANVPIGLVEVKRLSRDMFLDAPRVAAILDRCHRQTGGTMRHGCLAAIRVRKERDVSGVIKWLRGKIETTQPSIKTHKLIPAMPSRIRLDLGDEGIWYSYAICVMLKSV